MAPQKTESKPPRDFVAKTECDYRILLLPRLKLWTFSAFDKLDGKYLAESAATRAIIYLNTEGSIFSHHT